MQDEAAFLARNPDRDSPLVIADGHRVKRETLLCQVLRGVERLAGMVLAVAEQDEVGIGGVEIFETCRALAQRAADIGAFVPRAGRVGVGKAIQEQAVVQGQGRLQAGAAGEGDQAKSVSLWLRPDDNRFDIPENQTHKVTPKGSDDSIVIWRHSGVIYYLLGDQAETAAQQFSGRE